MMLRVVFLTSLLFGLGWSQDDFRREGAREAKDALEGKAPPELQVTGWMNSSPLKLKALRGKVVVLDFWGTW